MWILEYNRMDEKEQKKQELELELQWVKYRLMILETIEEKLQQMRLLAEQVMQSDLTKEEMEVQNEIFNDLAVQVRELDKESRKIVRWEVNDDLK